LWMHHHLLHQRTFHWAFIHRVRFRALNRTTPNKHYRLRYLLIQHELI
jgi:hypothetical protein